MIDMITQRSIVREVLSAHKTRGRHTRADGSDRQGRAHEQQGCVDNYMTLTNTTTVQIHVL